MPNIQPKIASVDSEHTELPSSVNKNISIDEIIYCLDVLKLNKTQTAQRLGCAKSNITQRLQTYGYQTGDLDRFKTNQADLLTIRRHRIAKALTDEKIQKMSAYQLVGMDSVTLQSERLIRGESTENIAYMDIVKAKQAIDDKVRAFEKKYGIEHDD